MSSTHIVYDSHSGQIISIHQGPVDAGHARQRAEQFMKSKGTARGKGEISVITVSSDALKRGKHYKVDVGNKALIETAATEGASFSSGATARSK